MADTPVVRRQPEAARQQPAEGLQKSLSVLIVDDEVALQRLVERILTRRGHAVSCCGNTTEARALLAQRTYDVLLSDIVMPGDDDGIGLAQWTHERFPDMHIALMSGYSRDQTPAAIKFPYLQKPYRREALLEIVERATSAAKPVAPQTRAG